MPNGANFSDLPLSDAVRRALKQMGFKRPTPIQAETIPIALKGRDLIGQSATGSGKTVAFGVPLLERIEPASGGAEGGAGQGVQALVITPTRELAIQVSTELERLAQFKPCRILAAFGGGPIDMQIAALRNGIDLLVGTPGRLLDLMYRGELDFADVKALVLDEADEMLNMGFIDDIEMIISCLPPERQTLLFSATMPEPIQRIAREFMKEPVHIQIEPARHNRPDIRQTYMEIPRSKRTEALQILLKDPEMRRAIIFCRTKSATARLAESLQKVEPSVAALHGDMHQGERNRVMNQFRRGQLRCLVATDVASRGIDVRQVTHVINYDCPDDPDSYVHRIGRTARAGRSGSALTFVSGREKAFLRAIEARCGPLEKVPPPPGIDVQIDSASRPSSSGGPRRRRPKRRRRSAPQS